MGQKEKRHGQCDVRSQHSGSRCFILNGETGITTIHFHSISNFATDF